MDKLFQDLEIGTRLSLDQFDILTHHQLVNITEAQHSLYLACVPFKEKGDIRPIQCICAIDPLNNLYEHVQEFCGLLNKTKSLPLIITALRYRLLVTLHLIEEKTCELIDLIDGYRVICMTSSQRGMHQRQEIYEGFEVLLQHIEELSVRVEFVINEAMFQEQKLTLDLEERSLTDLASITHLDSQGRLVHILKHHEDTIDAS